MIERLVTGGSGTGMRSINTHLHSSDAQPRAQGHKRSPLGALQTRIYSSVFNTSRKPDCAI